MDLSQVKKRQVVAIAGATGDLGKRIARNLLERGASVRALVRIESNTAPITELHNKGLEFSYVNYSDKNTLLKVLEGVDCTVSAISGLKPEIVDLQTILYKASVEAGVKHFIPSDFSIDYTKLPEGSNRNLDLRREFSKRLENSPINVTSVLNGMFADLLTSQAPVVLFPVNRILYYGSEHQKMDFTTIENTAAFTAEVALDPTAPRFLRIAGDVLDAHGLAKAASEATGKEFKLLRTGGLGLLKRMIGITRFLAPSKNEVFPAWQGMQYLHNMLSGIPKFEALDNNRYQDLEWTSVKEVLASRK